jgi:hypothetical protein
LRYLTLGVSRLAYLETRPLKGTLHNRGILAHLLKSSSLPILNDVNLESATYKLHVIIGTGNFLFLHRLLFLKRLYAATVTRNILNPPSAQYRKPAYRCANVPV